jgi:beta-lactamase class A
MLGPHARRLKALCTPPLIGAFVLGGVLGWLVSDRTMSPQRYTGGVLYQANDSYEFIDPLLSCDIGTEDTFTDLSTTKNALASVVNQATAKGSAGSVSVYFRSLDDAHWFDINPGAVYAPASLLKTFVMMAYYQEAREQKGNPAFLSELIPYTTQVTANPDEHGKPLPSLVPGQLYSRSDVIKQMIVYSDNDALNTLLDTADPRLLELSDEIFSDLKITSPLTQGDTLSDFMPVDQYAMVFRVLYGSTYLSRTYSDTALNLLSQAYYKGGLVAGVPSGVVVAHKYGISAGTPTATSSGTPELHDCGIIYYPGHPYLLCVMTRGLPGSDVSTLQDTIQKISATTYAQVDARYGSHS